MKITIKQIAEMANVHRSTVDKVLHNRPGVSDAVRKKVREIIESSGYEVDPIGKALKMRERQIRICAILLKVDALEFIQEGIEKELRNYSSFQIEITHKTTAYSEVEHQKKVLMQCLNEKVDGIILNPINAEEIAECIDNCQKAGIPVVTVNTNVKDSQHICFVGQDGFKAGKVAGRLMGEILQGKGNVAIFTGAVDDYYSSSFGTREKGFREVLEKYYPEINIEKNIITKESSEVIQKEMKKILEKEDDLSGIFITCGGVPTIGRLLKKNGCKNIKVICFENYPEIVQLLKKGIVTATIDSEIMQQGESALRILLDYLLYNRLVKERYLYSAIKILVKESLE